VLSENSTQASVGQDATYVQRGTGENHPVGTAERLEVADEPDGSAYVGDRQPVGTTHLQFMFFRR
jgi:hypothetical protein